MALVTGKGSEINFNSNVDLKKVYIRLKENESVRVRVLGLTDYVEYKAHSEYALKVYTQPCPEPNGQPCPLCVASKSGIDGFDKLYGKKRYLFAFADIDTGELRVWDCSKSQAKDLLGQIKEYEEDIAEVAFNFKRTGQKTETSYKLNPILKMKGDDVDKFHKFDDVEVELTFFESCLVPRSEKMMLDILNDAGFPMAQYFPNYTPEGEQAAPATEDDQPNF
ncbi:hypothetical protein JCM17380_24380 [Desulfosporosinus burensis]